MQRSTSEKNQPNRIKALQSQLFKEKTYQPRENEELEKLRNTGNVKAKAKMLDEFFKRFGRLSDILKQNAASKKARQNLVAADLVTFIQKQDNLLVDIKNKIQEDIQAYADKPALQREFSPTDFLKLSFYYRSYQVCLQQDILRHLAQNTQKAFYVCDPIILAFGHYANQVAVESLNYYQDFFKNLPAIETIWPDAGTSIRNQEMKDIYSSCMYPITKAILPIFTGQQDSECWQLFDNSYRDTLAAKPNWHDYIKNGDGLNMVTHPWTQVHHVRLPQPNATIDFNNIHIAPITPIHAVAIAEVKEKVNQDLQRRIFR